jgi:ketosteroid isomerase-like protein
MNKRIPSLALGLLLATTSAAVHAQPRRAPPPPPAEATPAIDPEAWWSINEAVPETRMDPLGGRRWSKRDVEIPPGFSSGVDASLYRLWGLQPLQGLVVRRGEAVFEAWFRPTTSARQAVVRIIQRSDGRTFLQARAGRGCCSPEITRRVDIDQELPAEGREVFRRLKEDVLWRQPQHVVVTEGGDVISGVCVNGASYDITLVEQRRAVHLRRSCDPVEVGSIAPALKAMVGAALGHDARFDAVFSRENFDEYAKAYQELRAAGGSVAAADASKEASADADAPTSEPADAQAEVGRAVAEILAADRAFAARSAEYSAAQAFREFMDADGLWLVPNREPVVGADAIHAAFGGDAPEEGKLTWEPVQAWASEAGDFGASWGRSRYTPNDASKPARAYRYMTVWRKDEQGKWRGLMDMGVEASDLLPKPPEPAPAQRRRR